MTGASIPSASESGPELFQAATAALFAAPSVTVTWSGHQKGVALEGSSSIAGESCAADASLALGHLQVIKNDTNLWAKLPALALDDIFGGRGAQALRILGSRFLHVDVTGDIGSAVVVSETFPVSSIRFLTNEVFSAESTDVTKGSVTTVHGQEAITLQVTGGGMTSNLAVATQGTPLILRAASTSTPDDIALDFTNFGSPVTVQAPPANQVLEATELAKQLG